MACFSLSWVEALLIWLVIVCAVIAVLKLLIPWILSVIGANLGIIPAILNIIFWAFIVICVIYLVFDLIGCLGGLSFPRLR